MTESQIAPPDCFQLAEIATLKTFEGQTLEEVNYYFWFNAEKPDSRFLYYLELLFANEGALLLTSGEESAAIRVCDAVTFIKRAGELQQQNGGQASIQRVGATASSVWQPTVDKPLEAIRLSTNDEQLYLNDALLFDFGAGHSSILVALNPQGGLSVQVY
jgi:hypothetical protein